MCWDSRAIPSPVSFASHTSGWATRRGARGRPSSRCGPAAGGEAEARQAAPSYCDRSPISTVTVTCSIRETRVRPVLVSPRPQVRAVGDGASGHCPRFWGRKGSQTQEENTAEGRSPCRRPVSGLVAPETVLPPLRPGSLLTGVGSPGAASCSGAAPPCLGSPRGWGHRHGAGSLAARCCSRHSCTDGGARWGHQGAGPGPLRLACSGAGRRGPEMEPGSQRAQEARGPRGQGRCRPPPGRARGAAAVLTPGSQRSVQ